VILATNIAETSLTVPGVTAVIDSGLCKQMRHEPAIGLDRLELVSISRQSAAQRAGRAGRTAPGRVLRLWSQHEHAGLLEAERPEISRVDLSPHLLSVLAFHPGDPCDFPFFERPADDALESALSLLHMLGAVKPAAFELTAKGRRLASLPVHPRIGCMFERAQELELVEQGALLAALLGERDIRRKRSAGTTDSDLLDRMELFEQFERGGMKEGLARELGVDTGAARAVKAARDQLVRLARPAPEQSSEFENRTYEQLLGLLLTGFPDRVCRRRRPGHPEAVMVGGRGVRLTDESGVRDAEFFLALEADAGKRGVHASGTVRMASRIDVKMLEEQLPHLMHPEEGAVFDSDRGAVVGVRRRTYSDLIIGEQVGVPVDPKTTAAVLANEVADRFEAVFKPSNHALQLRARLMLADRALPEASWPDVTDAALKRWLPAVCLGKSRLDEVERIDWDREMENRLDRVQRDLLDRELPERIRVPSGSRIRLDYTPALSEEGAPVLSVRLQEVFGLADTPRLARGRVAVRMHLLAPNGRPVQVTEDLKSFWNDTYQQVRKELRARYPKHAWPEDPWSAPPSAKATGKKRK
jgi:ATP-dependent helicase HrpB